MTTAQRQLDCLWRLSSIHHDTRTARFLSPGAIFPVVHHDLTDRLMTLILFITFVMIMEIPP